MWLFEKPIAHRGQHDDIDVRTENSMAAFRKAIESGYNIETDVHLLKSGEVVIFHDNTLTRVCGKKVNIKDLTLDDIQGDEYLLPNKEHIPLLVDLLQLVEGTQSGILLELKINGANYDLEKAVYSLIKGKESFIAVQSFNPWTVAWFSENAPEFYRGLLAVPAVLQLGKTMYKKMNPNFLAYDIKSLNNSVVKFITKKNINLLSWTIRTPELLDKALSFGVNNIIYEKLDLDALKFDMSKVKPIQ
ncbi:MAG: hypothetical protein IJ735_00275 [Clostridia bacterium]|nr:hypothetical protein [Clostridia bacterium]